MNRPDKPRVSNYRQGYLAELELVRMLKARKEFHTVLRSAGSRSAFDVVAFGESCILVCQVKTGKGSYKAEMEKLKQLKVTGCVRVQMWVFRNRKWKVFSIK